MTIIKDNDCTANIPLVTYYEYERKHNYNSQSLTSNYLKKCNAIALPDAYSSSTTCLPNLSSVVNSSEMNNTNDVDDLNITKPISSIGTSRITQKKWLKFFGVMAGVAIIGAMGRSAYNFYRGGNSSWEKADIIPHDSLLNKSDTSELMSNDPDYLHFLSILREGCDKTDKLLWDSKVLGAKSGCIYKIKISQDEYLKEIEIINNLSSVKVNDYFQEVEKRDVQSRGARSAVDAITVLVATRSDIST